MSKKKMTIQEWIDNINNNEMHHFGEYYSYLTGKKFQNQYSRATKGFLRWLEEQGFFSDKFPVLNWEKFNIYSDWHGEGFLFKKRIGD